MNVQCAHCTYNDATLAGIHIWCGLFSSTQSKWMLLLNVHIVHQWQRKCAHCQPMTSEGKKRVFQLRRFGSRARTALGVSFRYGHIISAIVEIAFYSLQLRLQLRVWLSLDIALYRFADCTAINASSCQCEKRRTKRKGKNQRQTSLMRSLSLFLGIFCIAR